MQEPLASRQGQSYQLGLLIKNVLFILEEANLPTPGSLHGGRPQVMSPATLLLSCPSASHRGAEAWTAPTYFTGPHPLLEAGPDPPWVWFAASKTLPQLREQAPYPSRCPLEPSTSRASIPDPASTDSASNQCKGGACHLRVSSDSMPAVSTLGEPQILEDSSRGLQDVGGSRSSRSSCSSAWLRRYMSM